ncbi:MAG: hypothetical protein FD169_731 [Bacillota bacterium]|nr:MAG: hypothetical protein FD169_731 [Bacillota bacterium]
MIWKKLQDIDRRIIYTLMIVFLLYPMMFPIGIPIEIDATTKDVFNTLKALNPATDTVVLAASYSVGGAPDVGPQFDAVAKHLFELKIPFLVPSFVSDGPAQVERVLARLESLGLVYGVDAVNLGFITGGEAAVKAFVDNPRTVFIKDFRGNVVADLPIMQRVDKVTDLAYVLDFQTGNPGYADWIRQAPGVKYGAGLVTVSVPAAIPFVNSKQIVGMLKGLRGAAEYELLMERPALAVAKMDAQSLGHLLIVALIILGNTAHFVDKKLSKK